MSDVSDIDPPLEPAPDFEDDLSLEPDQIGDGEDPPVDPVDTEPAEDDPAEVDPAEPDPVEPDDAEETLTTLRRPPSQRDPEHAVNRMSQAIQSMVPGTMGGRVVNAAPFALAPGDYDDQSGSSSDADVVAREGALIHVRTSSQTATGNVEFTEILEHLNWFDVEDPTIVDQDADPEQDDEIYFDEEDL